MVSLESSAALEPFAGMEPIFRSAENDTDGLDVQALAAAVRALPGRCRQVFTLRKLYALTHREIAQRLRLSERAVEQQIERGARHALSCLRPRVASTHELSAVAVRAAAVWLARRDRGLSSEETVDFLDWLRYAANDAAYAELDTAFRAFDRLQALPASTSETPDPNALAGTRPSRLRGGFAWIAAASLAAAAIAVIAVLQN